MSEHITMNIISVIICAILSLTCHITSLPTSSSCWQGNWWNGCCYRKCSFKNQNAYQYPQQIYQYPYQQQRFLQQRQYPSQNNHITSPQGIYTKDIGMSRRDPYVVPSQYALNYQTIVNPKTNGEQKNKDTPAYEDNKVEKELIHLPNASPTPLESIRHNPNNLLQARMKIPLDEIETIENNEESSQAKMKRNGNMISNEGSSELLNDEHIDDDDFFDSDNFYDFDDEPEVSIESVRDLPLCSDLSDIETEIGVECITENRNRDEVLEKILQQTWETLDISETFEPLIGDNLDPLNISRAIPGGEVSVSEEGSVYQANLTMSDITMYNLSKAHLKKILVTRSEDLTNLEVTAWLGLDLLTANGTYSIKGMLGWWPVDSDGVRAFHAEMYNATLAPKIRVDTRAGCDEAGNAIITDLKIPLEYDEVSFHMDNLGEFYNSVVNGIGVFLISSQNKLAVEALEGLIAKNIGSFAC